MNSKNYSDESNANSRIYPSCGTEVETARVSLILKKVQILFAVAAVITLTMAGSIIVLVTGKNTNITQKETVIAPQNIFYLKGSSLFYSSLATIKPIKITDKFYRDYRTITIPIFMSDNGKWIFYPQGHDEYADLYGSQLGAGQTNQITIAKNADIFTTNQDASKLIYLSDHKLFWGTISNLKMIAEKVDRYFTNKACDRVVYLSSDGTLYYTDTNTESRKLTDQVSLKYVSPDLNTIYYTASGALNLIKDCESIEMIYDGDPATLCIYESGDLYYQNGSALYYYSNGKSTQVSNVCSRFYSCNDGSQVYPYGAIYCGAAEPVIIIKDSVKNFFICRGAEILKKISGGYLTDAKFDSKGTGIYYIATNSETDREGDLFYVSIDGKKVSNSTKLATRVTVFSSYFVKDHLIYTKNANDYTGDLYIDGKMIDHGVYLFFNRIDVTRLKNVIFYPINTKNYFNKITNTNYTADTIMMYRNGVTKKVADNVIDYTVFDDKFVYLTVEDLDDDYGTLHLYQPDGEDRVIDTRVSALIRPTTDRTWGGEIDSSYAIYPPASE